MLRNTNRFVIRGRGGDVRSRLDSIYHQYHSSRYLSFDPLVCVRKYSAPSHIELAGLFCSCLSYGRVEQIIKSINTLIELMDCAVYRFVMESSLREKRARLRSFKHRFTTGYDIACLLEAAKQAIVTYGSLENCALHHATDAQDSIVPAMAGFAAFFRAFGKKIHAGSGRSYAYLIPSPFEGSACKRLNMYFRWMVRPDDGIDFGIWRQFKPSQLVIPVDIHIMRAAKDLGLTRRKRAEWKTAVEITDNLRSVAPDDPVKYDFSLCRHGMALFRKKINKS
ncbi:MAG: TIGR02757 family protein [Chitinivibrionales bacterium]|nr:TIGR02757 family protein [Chitinivibrionales bacterium]